MHIDIQLHNGRAEWPELRDRARRAEHDGFSRVWVYDHLDGSTLGGDREMLECFTLLGALAAATEAIGVGSMVANVANRHPAIGALAASSVQRISGGRFVFGVGAGAAPGSRFAAEHARHGITLASSAADRREAVAEQIRVVRAAPVAVPVVVGASSVSLAVLAGESADGLNVRLASAKAGEVIAAGRAAAGSRPFELSAYAPIAHRDAATVEAEALGLDRLILLA
jgi:alkanesulfonate monooxygenase SsuD/methylene tetrahydromethanopterin reductase-like flavin-dependent oxidoreductase (luciferase family)